MRIDKFLKMSRVIKRRTVANEAADNGRISVNGKIVKASGTSSKSSVRTIYMAEIRFEEPRIIIELTGNGFLYNMVRIIAGTLLEVGQGKIEPEDIPEIIKNGDRKKAGRTLPPHGLYLVEVNY